MELTEKTVQKNYVYRGKIISVRCDDAVLPDGRPCKRELVEHSGGACVLCVRGGKIALVKQFRYAYGKEILELPAGKINPDEPPEACASRELSEETGLNVRNLELWHTLYPTPGYTNEKIYIYYARNVEEGNAHLDEGEFLNVVYLPVEEVLSMIARGEICDAKTIVAVYRYALEQQKAQ